MFNRISFISTVSVIFLLLFAIGANLSPESNNNGDNISKLIYEFIINYKRLKFGIVFTCSRQGSEDILPFNIVAKQLMRGNVTLRAISVDDYDELDCSNFGKYAQLMRGLIAHHQFVLLDMNCARANKVLFEASRYELFNASFHWLIIDKKASSTNDDDDGAPDGTGTDRLQRGQWRNCRRRSQVPSLFGRGPPAVSGGNNGSFYSDDGDEDTTTLDRLETMNISINAEITLVRESSVANGDRRRKVYALFDIWNPGFISGGQLNVTAMGNYVVDNAGGGRLTVWFHHQSTVVRRRDMRGLKLKIMTVVTQRPGIPFEVYLATPNNTHLDSVHRYNFGLMSYIRDYFNFSFIMRRTKSWGYLRNGTFDGMIGALSRREVDLGGSPMFFRQERHRVVSYTTRSFMERPCFIFRHPKRQNTMRNPFLLPFETVIWYLMVFCGALLVVVLFSSYHFEESGFVVRRGAAKSSPIHTNKFDGPLKIEADDESYYGDSFHFNRSLRLPSPPPPAPSRQGLNPKRQPGTKENVLFNDTNKNNDDDDPNCCQQLVLRQWRKLLLSRRHLSTSQRQQRQRKSLHSNNDDTTANSSTTTLQAASKGKAPVVLQPAVHWVLPPGGVEHKETGDDATWRSSSNYKAEKLSKSILLFLGGVCQQGLSEIPRLPSGRCTSIFILVFGYLMFQFYSASIVGSLLMAPPKTIRTLRNLIDSRLALGIEDIPYSRDYFVRTTDADSLELFHTRVSFYDQKSDQNESHFLNAADGLHLTRKGGYAFHVAISAAYKIIRETFSELEICELTEIDMFPKSSQWMVAIVQKNSPYRDVITYGLRRLNEAGIMDRQRRVWQEPKPKCVRKIAPSDLIVGMDSVYSAFILLVAGALLSIGLLLIEILRHRLAVARRGRRRRGRQWQQPRTRPGNLPQDHGWVYPYVD